jgi:hypothetical protein
MFKHLLIQFSLLFVIVGAVHAAPRLDIGPVSGSAGSIVIPVSLANEHGTSIAALGVDIGYDATSLQKPTAVAGQAALLAGKGLAVSYPAEGVARLVIIGLNASAIDNGVVATITFRKKAGAAPEALSLTYAISASDTAGDEAAVEPARGSLAVE